MRSAHYYKECRVDESQTANLYWCNKISTFSKEPATCSRYERYFDVQDNCWISTHSIGNKPTIYLALEDVVEIRDLTRELLAIVEQAQPDICDVTCHLSMEKRWRYYCNNRGVELTSETFSYSVFMRYMHSRGIESYFNRGFSIDDLEQILYIGLRDMHDRVSWPQASMHPECLPQKSHLLLAPNVSSVLLHELVGHGCEEADEDMGLPFPFGPNFLQVSVLCPTSSGFDDEGVPTDELRLLKDGRLIRRVVDRERAVILGEKPSGLAQIGSHGGKPQVRCTHLKATGGSGDPKELISSVDKGILCLDTSGGEFQAGTAMVRVNAARYIRCGIAGNRVPQFFFHVRLNDFKHCLVAMATDESVGRTGTCVKDGDELPTSTTSPTMLLSDVSIWRASDGLGNS